MGITCICFPFDTDDHEVTAHPMWSRPYIPVPPALVSQSLFLSKHAWRQVL